MFSPHSGYTSDIFTHTWARVIFFFFFFFWGGGGGVKILNFNILGDFQKNEYFIGYVYFVDIFGGLSQNRTKFKSFLCILGS